MRRYLLLVPLLLSSCGPDPTDWITNVLVDKTIDEKISLEEPAPALRAVLDNFIRDCKDKYGANLSRLSKLEYIRYGNPATSEMPFVVGVCNTWTRDGALKKANIVVKQMKSDVWYKALLYHELGHCLLGLDHTPQADEEIMSPMLLPIETYEQKWDSQVERLCKKYRR